ncbi:MAG: hypothetical protein ACLTDV_00120 [Eubacterium sp.]
MLEKASIDKVLAKFVEIKTTSMRLDAVFPEGVFRQRFRYFQSGVMIRLLLVADVPMWMVLFPMFHCFGTCYSIVLCRNWIQLDMYTL